MKIMRRYRFYAAHRNPRLSDKCARLHGHRYGVEVGIEVIPGEAGVGILFAEIDGRLGPIFERLDHRTLLADEDPLANLLPSEQVIRFAFPTSAENLAAWLLAKCRLAIPDVISLALTETDSATIIAVPEDLASWPTS